MLRVLKARSEITRKVLPGVPNPTTLPPPERAKPGEMPTMELPGVFPMNGTTSTSEKDFDKFMNDIF